jgi:hypothetical protein
MTSSTLSRIVSTLDQAVVRASAVALLAAAFLGCGVAIGSAQEPGVAPVATPAPPTPPAPPPPPPPAARYGSGTGYGQEIPTPQAPPPPPPIPYVETYDAANPPDAILDPTQAPGRGPWGQAAFQLGMPIFLSTPRASVDLGYSFLGRFGFHLGALVPELQLGYMNNGYSGDTAFSDASLSNTFFGAGMRAYIPTGGMVMPFGALHVNFNFWNNDFFSSDFALGFDGELGLLFHVHPIVAIEASARVGQTFAATTYFSDVQFWITPQLGATFFFY